MYMLDTIFNDLRSIINSIVIKYEKKAKELDTLEILRAADQYVSAMNKQDSFLTYPSFDVDIIISAGITDVVFAQQCADNKNLIPVDKREAVILKQREYVIRTYVEQNNYYRMLNGYPDLEDTNFIYVDADTCEALKIDPLTPMHLLSDEDISKLEYNNKLQPIKDAHTDKKYLDYLGSNRISIVSSRTARNFTILRMYKTESESFYEEFNIIYEQSREYFLSVIHNSEYSKQYLMYDNFIALMIMVMTIQRIITNTFKYGIERDFYDLGSIKMMFDAYNVPFIVDLPIEYQRILMRNLNTLLRYKSTDKVLYDICSLLGFERIKILNYFLIKQHKTDEFEKPIFIYKQVTDELGNTTTVEDVEQMYDFYFQSVDLNERNIPLALADNASKLSYEEVTIDDPYWWGDDDLKQLLYDEEFNYVETKFLNMNIMYKLTEMLFEVIYTFRMLVNKKDELGAIDIFLPKLFGNTKKIKIFNVVVLLCALLSKKNHMAGNILITPSKILSIMGFNFEADFTAIQNYIKANPKIIDQSILTYIQNMNITKADDINGLFNNIRNLNDFLVERISNSENVQEYHAYKKLFNALMVSQESEELFTKSDGTVATTFIEYLQDMDVDLYNFVNDCEPTKISEYIDHIIFKMNELIKDLKYLYILNDSNNVLLNAVITLIRFFKSYTTDLASFNILYLMDSKYFNKIKMVHDIHLMTKLMQADDSFRFLYNTVVNLEATVMYKEKMQLRDNIKLIWED